MSRNDSDFTYNSQHIPIAPLNHRTGAPFIPRAPVWVIPPPKRRRREWLVALLIFVMIAVIGAGLGAFFWATRLHLIIPPKFSAGGHAFFTTSLYFDAATGLPSVDDKLQIDLQNIPPPAPDKSYYGWLLGDKNQPSSTPIALGVLTVDHGTVHHSYVDPQHTNLLGVISRILITEEETAQAPLRPSNDTHMWKYSAELPQTPDPNDTQYHLSMLDHLRLLLVQDSALGKDRPGGLDIWFLKNTGRVAEWAYSARGLQGTTGNAYAMQQHFIRILNYLDGDAYARSSGLEVVASTPLGLLGPDTPDAQNSRGADYLHLISDHLTAMAQAPSVTPEKRQVVARIIASINIVRDHLQKVRQYAKQLRNLNDAKLDSQDTASLLNDMMAEAFYAYAGQLDPSTAELQSGAVQIQQEIEHLATFDIAPYNP